MGGSFAASRDANTRMMARQHVVLSLTPLIENVVSLRPNYDT
jgi:hypothetical protein